MAILNNQVRWSNCSENKPPIYENLDDFLGEIMIVLSHPSESKRAIELTAHFINFLATMRE